MRGARAASISWSSATTPTPLEVYPALAFDRLFRDDVGKSDKSVLDAVMAEARENRVRKVRIDFGTEIDAEGTVYWNDEAVKPAELQPRLASAARREPQPELQLRADRATRYEAVAQLMAAAQQEGLTKLVFVTDPKEKK